MNQFGYFLKDLQFSEMFSASRSYCNYQPDNRSSHHIITSIFYKRIALIVPIIIDRISQCLNFSLLENLVHIGPLWTIRNGYCWMRWSNFEHYGNIRDIIFLELEGTLRKVYRKMRVVKA